MILAAIAPLARRCSGIGFGFGFSRRTKSKWRKILCSKTAGSLPKPSLRFTESAAKSSPPEGPFGDHYGYYSLEHDYPILNVEAVFHRKDAIYPATVVGKPRQEDFFIGDYLQELLSPLFPLVMPAVRDLWSYGETGFHSLAAAVVRERYGREALERRFRILGEGQLALTKFLLLTDKPQDLRDFKSLFEHILARVNWKNDFFIFTQTSFDTLDYASAKSITAQKRF
jgi:UbiD family decarboxylase